MQVEQLELEVQAKHVAGQLTHFFNSI